jgi:hypothetical protein
MLVEELRHFLPAAAAAGMAVASPPCTRAHALPPQARAAKERSSHVEFRWVALITLWTLLVGPIFDQPPRAHTRPARTLATVKVSAGAVASAPMR